MGKVGTKLQEIREKYGLNQTELAKRLGFSRSYIAMVEAEKIQTGGFIPSLDFIRILANSFSLGRVELEELRDSDKSKAKKPMRPETIADIKTSLAVILGNAELVLRQEEGFSAEGKKWLEQIKKQVWRIDELLGESDLSLRCLKSL